MASSKPTFSVVICSLNGAERIGDALRSLNRLDYPKDKYEVIVVDDGSTDNLATVVGRFKRVRLISHKKNQGRGAARTTGMKHARGTFVAYIDDDCIAGRGWLRELERSFANKRVMAAGGLIGPTSTTAMTQRYLFASGYGRPAPMAMGTAKSVFGRFAAYLKNKFSSQADDPVEGPVYEVYGANSAFRRSALKKVGGFDRTLTAAEDTDICRRLHDKQPGKIIWCNPKAVVTHGYTSSFARYLSWLFRRQRDNLRFYQAQHKTPPIYPFPLGIAAVVAASWLVAWWAPLIGLGLLPLGAYSWWLARAVRMRRLEYVVFAYMQWLEESTLVLGLAWAAMRQWLGRCTLAAALFALVLMQVLGNTMAHLPLAIVLIGLPGYLLLRLYGGSVARQAMDVATRSAFAGALGALWLMLVGLAAVVVLPLFGVDRPLDAAPLAGMYVAATLYLGWRAVKRPALGLNVRAPRTLSLDTVVVLLGSLVTILASLFGAALLNKGYGNQVAMTGVIVAACLVLFTVLRTKALPRWGMALVLFSVSVAALWSYSLRSGYLVGWDIQQEYSVFVATCNPANWHLGANHTPYDAMLSLTVFPTAIAKLSGLSGLTIFKVLFPLIFSLVPVLLYGMYRVFAKRWVAFAGAALFIAQFSYMQEFSALARQQLAFLFFAGLLYAVFGLRASSRARNALISATVLGMVLSHYSTTYFALALLALTYAVARGVAFVRRRKSADTVVRPAYYLRGWTIALLAIATIIWYGPMTHSSTLLAHITKQKPGEIVRNIQKAFEPQESVAGIPSGENYLEAIGGDYRLNKKYLTYYDGASNKAVRIQQPQQITPALHALQPVAKLLDTALRYSIWIFAAAGIAYMAWRLLGYFEYRRMELVLLGFISVAAFAAIHVVPAVGTYYNITRLNQQALMIAGIATVISASWLLKRWSLAWRKVSIGLAVALCFSSAAGLMVQWTGGNPTVNLNNIGNDYQRYYINDTDVAAAKWLAGNRGPTDVTFADRYANLRLTGNTNLHDKIMYDVTPETLAQGAFVYADRTNIVDGVTLASYKGRVVIVSFPAQFLANTKNILYSNDQGAIYR